MPVWSGLQAQRALFAGMVTLSKKEDHRVGPVSPFCINGCCRMERPFPLFDKRAYVSPFMGVCSPLHGRSFPFHGRSFPFSKGVVVPGVGVLVLAIEPYPTRPREGGVGGRDGDGRIGISPVNFVSETSGAKIGTWITQDRFGHSGGKG